jgi:hypothetical protein
MRSTIATVILALVLGGTVSIHAATTPLSIQILLRTNSQITHLMPAFQDLFKGALTGELNRNAAYYKWRFVTEAEVSAGTLVIIDLTPVLEGIGVTVKLKTLTADELGYEVRETTSKDAQILNSTNLEFVRKNRDLFRHYAGPSVARLAEKNIARELVQGLEPIARSVVIDSRADSIVVPIPYILPVRKIFTDFKWPARSFERFYLQPCQKNEEGAMDCKSNTRSCTPLAASGLLRIEAERGKSRRLVYVDPDQLQCSGRTK